MGAERFETKASGKTPEEAFTRARDRALYDYGHRGYTGTIAEKTSFEMVARKSDDSIDDVLRRCEADREHFSNEKWGPSACAEIGPSPNVKGETEYIFFGWASS